MAHRGSRHGLLAVLLLVLGGCQRCGDQQDTPKASPGGQLIRLARLPEGTELGEAVFSPGGKHFATILTTGGKAQAFHDGKLGKPHDGVMGLTLHEPSGRLAYVAQDADGLRVVLDDAEGPVVDELGQLRFSSAGKLLHSVNRAGKWSIALDGREWPTETSDDPDPRFASGGDRIAWSFVDPAGKASLRICDLQLSGCVKSAEYDALSPVQQGGAGETLAYVASAPGKAKVVTMRLEGGKVVERASAWYQEIGVVAVSRQGGVVAFLARREGQDVVVVADQEHPIPAIEAPLDLEVAPNGRWVLTANEKEGVTALVRDLPAYRTKGQVAFPALSPDGAAVAMTVEVEGRARLVVNGAEGPPFDKVVTPRFTPDGAKVVYRARQTGRRFVVVADVTGRTLREHPHYDAVFDVMIAPDGKSVGYGVRKGRDLYWVIEPT